MAPGAQLPVAYHALRVFASGQDLTIQPEPAAGADRSAAAAAVETLTIKLDSGIVQVSQQARFPASQGTTILAILGLNRLFTGHALVVVTAARHVATLQGGDVFRIEAADLLTAPRTTSAADGGAAASAATATVAATASREDLRLLKLLRDAVDPDGAGRDMFFSCSYDLTLSAQRISIALAGPDAASRPLSARADLQYTWNHALIKPLVAAGAGRFVVPAIMGFVEQLPGLLFSSAPAPQRPVATTSTGTSTSANAGTRAGTTSVGAVATGATTTTTTAANTSGVLTLIARRSPHRAGTRHWRRGCDRQGNASNFVETEQLLSLSPSGGGVASLSSFVQLRGSVPLLWSETPNLKFKPGRVIAPFSDSAPAFDRHMKRLVEQYKRVTAVNLVGHHGSEGRMASDFEREAQRFTARISPELRYVAFDFHRECKLDFAAGLAELWGKVSHDVAQHGFFLTEGPQVVRRQEGVVRSNCIDCLDRTNVVQGMLARRALEMVLRHYKLLPAAESSLPDAYPSVEQQFKVLWADHGDSVSMQYAGTGALKSGFTRTGVRTLGGAVDDGVKSVTRYFLNNFHDGRKQDALDLFTGHYTVDPQVPLPPPAQASPLVPLLLAVVAVLYGLHVAGQAAGRMMGRQDVVGGTLEAFAFRDALLPLLLGVGVLMLVVANGRHLVNKPQLCLQLAYTAGKPQASRYEGGTKRP